MQHGRGRGTQMLAALVLLVLALSFPPGTAFAKKQPKTYPEEGKVIGMGFNQLGRSRTYKVETDTRIYELDCSKPSFFPNSAVPECGGERKLQIGDVIHFRTEKGWAHIPVSAFVSDTDEQKLRILREEMKPNAKRVDKTQAAEPAKTNAKPEEEKQ